MENSDRSKEVSKVERSKSFEWARKILNDGDEDYKTEVLQSLYVELADLRAEQKTKVDYYEDKLESMQLSMNEWYECLQKEKAENEQLKEWKKEAEASLIEAGKNVSEMYDKAFISELQRRWPSEERISEAISPIRNESIYAVGFGKGVNWLKSYLNK